MTSLCCTACYVLLGPPPTLVGSSVWSSWHRGAETDIFSATCFCRAHDKCHGRSLCLSVYFMAHRCVYRSQGQHDRANSVPASNHPLTAMHWLTLNPFNPSACGPDLSIFLGTAKEVHWSPKALGALFNCRLQFNHTISITLGLFSYQLSSRTLYHHARMLLLASQGFQAAVTRLQLEVFRRSRIGLLHAPSLQSTIQLYPPEGLGVL